jgi:hypothetical protein
MAKAAATAAKVTTQATAGPPAASREFTGTFLAPRGAVVTGKGGAKAKAIERVYVISRREIT